MAKNMVLTYLHKLDPEDLPLILKHISLDHHLGTGRIGRAGTCVTLVTGREKIFKAPGNLWESVVDFSIEHGDQVDQTSKNSYV